MHSYHNHLTHDVQVAVVVQDVDTADGLVPLLKVHPWLLPRKCTDCPIQVQTAYLSSAGVSLAVRPKVNFPVAYNTHENQVESSLVGLKKGKHFGFFLVRQDRSALTRKVNSVSKAQQVLSLKLRGLNTPVVL